MTLFNAGRVLAYGVCWIISKEIKVKFVQFKQPSLRADAESGHVIFSGVKRDLPLSRFATTLHQLWQQ